MSDSQKRRSGSDKKSRPSSHGSSVSLDNSTISTGSNLSNRNDMSRSYSMPSAARNKKNADQCVSPSISKEDRSGVGKTNFDNHDGRRRSNGNGKSALHKTCSHDRVRKIVLEEGRSARNLIAYNVPASDNSKPVTQASNKPLRVANRRLTSGSGRDVSPAILRAGDTSSVRSGDRSGGERSGGESRPSSSAGSHARKMDMRARYWAFLFDNLKRAVDEIYQTCEADESVDECKEVIMILQQCTKDFRSLINQWNIVKTYQHMEESGQKPTSLAWEVRKTSPGKFHVARDRSTPSPASVYSSVHQPTIDHNSWADLVKGTFTVQELETGMARIVNSPQPPTHEPPINAHKPVAIKLEPEDQGDVEGWETVRRSRSRTSPPSKTSCGSSVSSGSGKFQKPSLSAGKGDGPVTKLQNFTAELTVNAGRPEAADQKTDRPSGYQQPRPAQNPSYRDAVARRSNENLLLMVPPSSTSTVGAVSATSRARGSRPAVKPATPRRLDMEAVASSNKSTPLPKVSTPARVKPLQKAPVDTKACSLTSSLSAADSRAPCDQTNGPAVEAILCQQATRKVSPSTESNDVSAAKQGCEDEDMIRQAADDHLEALVPIGICSDGGDGDGDDEDEDVLAMQLEEALEGVLDEVMQEQDAAIESAIQEEQSYLKEIEQAEKDELDLYQNEADEAAILGDSAELGNTASSVDSMGISATSADLDMMMARYEAETERRKLLGLSWADVDEAESRTPGRGAHMHEKLSSPSRKRSILESKKRHEERQAKAAELREKFIHEKAERLKDLTRKVEEVREWKDELLNKRREYLERKLQQAEEKRQRQLSMKVKKAHEEETKANEIAFINTLSEQNKKMDILNKHDQVEARLHDIHEERQRRIDEKAAKEAAVEERRKALAAERLARLVEMQEKRKRREVEIEQKNFERDKERTEAAKVKEREHRDRLAQLEKQQQIHIVELQKKIEQKQQESTRRYNEALQSIREKAFISNILKHSTEDHNEVPKLEPYDTKKICTVCKKTIPSEVHLMSHLRGKLHQKMLAQQQTETGVMTKKEIETFNIEHIQDVPRDFVDPKQESNRERARSLKKKCKKLRQRMQSRGNEYEASLGLRQETADSDNKAKLSKTVKDISKFIQSQEKGPWPQNKISALDRALGEAARVLEKKVVKDQTAFRIGGGLSTLVRLLQALQEETVQDLYPKTYASLCQVIRLACKNCFENCHYILFSNRICTLVDVLTSRILRMGPDPDQFNASDSYPNSALDEQMPRSRHATGDSSILIDQCATALMHTVSTVLVCLSNGHSSNRIAVKTGQTPGLDAFSSRTNDVISYIIAVGVVDKLQSIYNSVRISLDDNLLLYSFLSHSINLLTAMTKLIYKKSGSVFDGPMSDQTPLMQTLEDTELFGIMSLLYGVLLHNVPTRGESHAPAVLSPNTLTVAHIGLKLVNQVATMDIQQLQRVLGTEEISLELRHIISYLIWYCGHHSGSDELLHEAILCVGYFAVLNPDNQMVIQSGQPPTILQQLCSLPFQYFSDPRLTAVLYPCLISCCFNSTDNKAILEQELSCELLANFIEEMQLESQQKQASSFKSAVLSSGQTLDSRMALACRFPQSLWTQAKEFFTVSKALADQR